ncbi:hypothetical protein [Flavobacterium sp.]|uniref:hypothetical protein n=1 Tax=Flavobacterium sp. TaxID=239 RepID=UPI004034BF88
MKQVHILLLILLFCTGVVASCEDKEQDGMDSLAGTWRMTYFYYDGLDYCPGCAVQLRFQHCSKIVKTCDVLTTTYTLAGDTVETVEFFLVSPDRKLLTVGKTPYRIARLTRKELVLTDTSGVLYRADYVRE